MPPLHNTTSLSLAEVVPPFIFCGLQRGGSVRGRPIVARVRWYPFVSKARDTYDVVWGALLSVVASTGSRLTEPPSLHRGAGRVRP